MGKPGTGNYRVISWRIHSHVKRTRGSETSQYPQEEKSIEIPAVAASETGIAQTVSACRRGVVGLSLGLARRVIK